MESKPCSWEGRPASFTARRKLARTAISESDTERQVEQALDRAYWEPLRREMEAFRWAERLE